MRQYIFLLKSILIITGVLFANICLAESKWDGTYSYNAALGNTAGGSPIIMTYKLTLSKSKCLFSIDGFQTMDRIICKTTKKGDNIDVQFQSYANGTLNNEFGVQVYTPDEILFKLSKHDNMITTTWMSEKPAEKLPKSGVYFKIEKDTATH